MPMSEFIRHKAWWKHTRWGLEHDILAIIASQIIADRTQSKPLDPWRVKEMATHKGFANKLLTVMFKPASVIRRGFMSVIDAVKGVADRVNINQ